MERARMRAHVAPAEPSAIIADDFGEARDLWLNLRPAQRRARERGVEQNGGAALTESVKMHPITADIDELSWRRESMPLVTRRETVIKTGKRCQKKRQYGGNGEHQDAASPR